MTILEQSARTMTTGELAALQGDRYAKALGITKEEGRNKLRWFAESILSGMKKKSRQHFPLPTDDVNCQKTLVIEKINKETFRVLIERE
ncbi:MAG: hypothetical protein JSR99_12190 [Proteobacteria bacterium]|nr:hypothetical protein [Pseudomonadota bacterium]